MITDDEREIERVQLEINKTSMQIPFAVKRYTDAANAHVKALRELAKSANLLFRRKEILK